MTKKKDNKDLTFEIRTIELGSYTRPEVKESRGDDFVLYGRDNYFFQKLIDLNEGSPTNASINKTYSDLIYGQGLRAKNASSNIEQWTRFKQIITDDHIKRICIDFQMFGSAAFQGIETKGKGLAQLVHVPRNMVAPGKADEKGDVNEYWFCRDWGKRRKDEFKPKAYPAFERGKKEWIYDVKNYSPGKEYYADPDYLAAVPYCDMESELANLNIRSIKQGLIAGYIINVPNAANWSDEQKEEFEKRIKQKLTGTNNASQFVLSFNGRDVEITVTPFPVNERIHKQWEFLVSEARQQILTAHRATSPSLAGVISSSGFSNTADEMDMAEKQLVKRVIKPKQDAIINALNDVLTSYEINLDLYFEPLTPDEPDLLGFNQTRRGSTPGGRVDLSGFDPNQPRDKDGKWTDGGKTTTNKPKIVLGNAGRIIFPSLDEKYNGLIDYDIYYNESTGIITLSRIVVTENERGGGIGGKYLKTLINYANSIGATIALTPSSDFGGDKEKLIKWYKKYGFVLNRGENKDFLIRDLMYRPPNTTQFAKISTDRINEMNDYLDAIAEPMPEGFQFCFAYPVTEPATELRSYANSVHDSDDGLWKIRYRYTQGVRDEYYNDDGKGESRPFCKKMTELSNNGRVFRIEDILKMEQDGVNKEFGHPDADGNPQPYSIWLHAGGINCYHRWERAIFKKKRNDDGEPLGGNATQNTFPVNVNEARRQGAPIPGNDPDVAKPEITKPSRGHHPDNPNYIPE